MARALLQRAPLKRDPPPERIERVLFIREPTAARCGSRDSTRRTATRSRAIVVHGAWYVNEVMIGHSGMLGRSQGCFAVADSSLPEIMARLGPGRLIYANKA